MLFEGGKEEERSGGDDEDCGGVGECRRVALPGNAHAGHEERSDRLDNGVEATYNVKKTD